MHFPPAEHYETLMVYPEDEASCTRISAQHFKFLKFPEYWTRSSREQEDTLTQHYYNQLVGLIGNIGMSVSSIACIFMIINL